MQDFHINRFKRRLLSGLLGIAFAVVSGADDYEDMAEYGRQKIDFQRVFWCYPTEFLPTTPRGGRLQPGLQVPQYKGLRRVPLPLVRRHLASLQHHPVVIDRNACRGKVLQATAPADTKKAERRPAGFAW